jgi:hypothetical protein
VTVIINHSPQLDRISDLTLVEGDRVEIKIRASDIDVARDPAMDGRITLVLLNSPPFVSLNDEGAGRGTLVAAPDAGASGGNQQVFNVTVEARDRGTPPLNAAASFTVTVKAPSQPAVPLITSAVFKSKKLTITGLRLGPSPQVEINGLAADPSRITLQSDAQIALSGNKKKLNLKRGTNTAVVVVNGVRSAPFNFTVGK